MIEILQSGWAALDLQWWQALAAIGAVSVGGTISGLTGFGFGLVIVPILLLIFSPVEVVVLSKSLSTASSLPILLADWRLARGKLVMRLFVPAVAGMLVGAQVLTRADPRFIKLIAGIAVVSFTGIVIRGFIIPGIRSRLAPIVAGFASGGLGIATGMSGPPVVLFLTDRALPPRVFRASIVAYFVSVDMVAAALVIQADLVGRREMYVAAMLLPFALAGRRLGQRYLSRVDQAQFRKVTLTLLVVTGTVAMVTATLAFL